MRRRGLTVAISAVATAILGPSGASAATQVGSECSGVTTAPGYTMLQGARGAGTALTPAGVITKWTVNSSVSTPQQLRLRVFRSTGKPSEYQTVAESGFGAVFPGSNTFDTRISVQANDHVGTYGPAPSGPLYCAGVPGDILNYFPADTPVGTTQTYAEAGGLAVALVATVEPDADGDGYGDETQDQCTRSSALQTPCPSIAIDAVPVAKKGSVVLFVTTTTSTSVRISGFVKVANQKEKRATSSARVKVGPVTATVQPSLVNKVVLKFPAKLKSQLASLPRQRSLKLKLFATATDAVGVVTTDSSSVKLKGQLKKAQPQKG